MWQVATWYKLLWTWATHLASLLGWLKAWGFPQQTFHIPGITNILRSSLLLSLIFTHHPLRGCLQESWPTLPGLPGLPLKSEWKLPLPYNSWILHACQTSTMGIPPRSADSLTPVGHSCRGFWVSGRLTPGEHFSRPCRAWRASRSSLSKEKSLRWVRTFYPWSYNG
jgi:hypothetical protein